MVAKLQAVNKLLSHFSCQLSVMSQICERTWVSLSRCMLHSVKSDWRWWTWYGRLRKANSLQNIL